MSALFSVLPTERAYQKYIFVALHRRLRIKKYPNKQFNFLVAFKKGKDYQDMLPIIIPWARKIILTSFYTEDQDMINASEKPSVVGNGLKPFRTEIIFEIIPNLRKAWEEILKKQEPIVVTGSLYLIGEIFKLIKNK